MISEQRPSGEHESDATVLPSEPEDVPEMLDYRVSLVQTHAKSLSVLVEPYVLDVRVARVCSASIGVSHVALENFRRRRANHGKLYVPDQ